MQRWTQPAPGVWIADFGRNVTGRIGIRSKDVLASGTQVRLTQGERLHVDGRLNPMTAVAGQVKGQKVPPGSRRPSTAVQSDTVVAAAAPLDWKPFFTYHGFRYCEVSGVDNPDKRLELTAETVRSHVAPGRFSRVRSHCSSVSTT